MSVSDLPTLNAALNASSAAFYFTILITHTVGAVVIAPLVLVTLRRALRGRFAAHRAIARVTLPLWGWVSVSGVVVYWMLPALSPPHSDSASRTHG